MAASIRIKLADLLKIMAETPPVRHRPTSPDILADLEDIKAYLQNGPARRSDLEAELDMSGDAVLRRLGMLKAAGEIVNLPDHSYQFVEHG
jgi:Mn-dependent DtxR family transcriptional regulator